MLEVEPSGQRGRMANRSGRNVLEAEKNSRRLRLDNQASNLIGSHRLWSSVWTNHRKGPK